MALKETGVKLITEGISGFLSDMRKATKAVGGFGDQSNSVSDQLEGIGGKVLGFGKLLSGAIVGGAVAGTAAVAGLGVASLNTAISFESAFAGVIKTTDGLVDEFGNLNEKGENLQQGFRDLAKAIPVSFEELAGIGELGGQLGIAEDQLLSFTETIAQVGVTTNLSIEDAATGFAQFSNIMGTPQEQISNLASTVVALGNNMATTESDIFNFAQRIAGAGSIAGLTEADVLGISAAFASVGISAEAGGTATQKVLLEMNKAILEGGDKLQLFADASGITVKEFTDAFEQDAGAAFSQFVKELGTEGDNAALILDELGLKDQQLVRAFLSLANAGDLVTDSLGIANEAFEDNTALSAEAEARFRTTEAQIQIFKNVIKDLGFVIGGPLLESFNDMLQSVRPIVEQFGEKLPGIMEGTVVPAIEKVVGFLSDNLPMAIETVSGILGSTIFPAFMTLANILGEVLPPIFTFIVENIEILQGALVGVGAFFIVTAIQSIGASIAALSLPITLIVGAAIALGIAWQTNFLGIRDITKNVIDFLKKIIKSGLDFISSFWDKNGKQITQTVTELWDSIVELFEGALSFLFELIQDILNSIRDFWERHGDSIITVVSAYFNFLAGIFTSQLELLSSIVSGVLDIILGFWNDNKDKIIAVVTNLWESVKGLFEAAGESLGLIVDGIAAAIEGDWETFGENIRASFETSWNAIVNVVDTVKSSLLLAVNGLINSVISLFTETDWLQLGQSIVNGIIDALVEGIPTILETLGGILDNIGDFFGGIFGGDDPPPTPTPPTPGGPPSADLIPTSGLLTSVLNPSNVSIDRIQSPAQIINNSVIDNSRTMNFEFNNRPSELTPEDRDDLAVILGMSS